jgi:Transglycosylase SLT domain
MSIPFLACMVAAAAFYHLPPRVLPSIQAVEGGQIGSVHVNANGTADLGVMQVNTIWIRPLSRYARLEPTVVATRLIYDPCFNIAASGAIMRTYIAQAHGNLMLAIGYYHSHTPALSTFYERQVLTAARRLFSRYR